MTHKMNSRVAREERKDGAMIGQTERNKLSPEGQIIALDLRLGKGVGAKKERARLAREIAMHAGAKKLLKKVFSK